jgi:hypothetical protein
LTGFLGGDKEIRALLKGGTHKIKFGNYTMFVCPMEYNEWLPIYYNNNQRFLQKHLDPKIIQSTKIFEKAEIRWICIDQLKKMRSQFRSFYQNIIDEIIANKSEIIKFVKERKMRPTTKSKKSTKKSKKSTKKNKSNKYI